MKIQLMSDLHLEFFPQNSWENFINSINFECDVLVLAGDICNYKMLNNVLGLFSTKCKHIIFINGNHELYGTSFDEFYELLGTINYPNVNILNNDIVEIDGTRFIGSTLWFKNVPGNDSLAGFMNDFRQIKRFVPRVYEENNKALNLLVNKTGKDCVVITHHLPSYKSVHKKYEHSALNRFFVCDVEWLIEERQPKYWLHAHTHESCDYKVGETMVLCNPFGYAGYEENPSFKEKLVFEV